MQIFEIPFFWLTVRFLDFDFDDAFTFGRSFSTAASFESKFAFLLLDLADLTVFELNIWTGCWTSCWLLCSPFERDRCLSASLFFCDSDVSIFMLVGIVYLKSFLQSIGENFLCCLIDTLLFLLLSKWFLDFCVWLSLFVAKTSDWASCILSIKAFTDLDVLDNMGENVL